MKFKKIIVFNFVALNILISSSYAEEKQPELSPEIIEKLTLLKNGKLNQLEKIKLADELQRAGAKSEALALYQENITEGKISSDIPTEAYLNYGTALLEKGEAQKGLATYEALSASLDPNDDKSKKINEIIEKNTLNYFQVQEQKKEQEKKEKEENKDKKDQKDNQSGSGGSDQESKGQEGNSKDQKNKNDQSGEPKDKKDKKDGEGKEEKDKSDKNEKDKNKDNEGQDEKESNNKDGNKPASPPPKVPPKLKQLMSDDRQLQLKVIEQGTRDMNRRNSRENKDW